MPKNLFAALILSVIAAAAVTVWIATTVSGGVNWWVMLVPLVLAVGARLVWNRLNSR